MSGRSGKRSSAARAGVGPLPRAKGTRKRVARLRLRQKRRSTTERRSSRISPMRSCGHDAIAGTSGVGAQLLALAALSDRRPLALLMAAGARSRHEVESASQVQDQIPRRELADVRASARPARRRDAVALRRSHERVASVAVRSTRWAEAVLGPRDRDRVDAPACLPLAIAPGGGLLAVGAVFDGRRSRSPRPTSPRLQ